MTIRNITELKALFENGDTPDQDAFGDWLDTMFQVPLVVEIKGIILVDSNVPANNLNFEVDISTSSSFATFSIQAKTLSAQTNWEYWNGVSMQPMPADGLHPPYQNQDTGLVTYTWPAATNAATRGITYYVRYRSGFSDVWGDYRAMKVTV